MMLKDSNFQMRFAILLLPMEPEFKVQENPSINIWHFQLFLQTFRTVGNVQLFKVVLTASQEVTI